jgi:hypothetical protein
MDFEDKQLVCSGCQSNFVWSAGEQDFFYRTGVREGGQPWPPPKRCKACQGLRKHGIVRAPIAGGR